MFGVLGLAALSTAVRVQVLRGLYDGACMMELLTYLTAERPLRKQDRPTASPVFSSMPGSGSSKTDRMLAHRPVQISKRSMPGNLRGLESLEISALAPLSP
jgi:hypothetical protein